MHHAAILSRALTSSRTTLLLENVALRHQLAVLRGSVPRPRLKRRDRILWVLLRRLWSGWKHALVLVQPETVVRWHRLGWRLLWRHRSQGRPGRTPIAQETRDLIRRLSQENRFWGAPRIRAELALLGHRVALSTVERYMARYQGPPSPTWRAFLRVHGSEILACDFFTIPTAAFGSIVGFVVMSLDRRRILACDVTAHPTAIWAAGVVRRAARAGGGVARYLLRDRDSVYGQEFGLVVRAHGLRQIVTAYHAPLQNAFVERLIGTLRRECLDHVLVFGEGHARRVLTAYAEYYNRHRAHQALGGDSPVPRPVQRDGRIVAESHLGGLHHSYRRVA